MTGNATMLDHIMPVEFERLEPRRYYDREPPRRCAVCRCDPRVDFSTPIVLEDERTGIGVPIDIIHTCSSWYCRERAKHLAEIYPSIELAPRVSITTDDGHAIIYRPGSISYLDGI